MAKKMILESKSLNVYIFFKKIGKEKIKIATADIEGATAWKNGMFLFNRSDIKSIMRQLSRWYDFEVRYEHAFENRNFSGMISRKTALEQVLKMLQMTKDVKFRVEGRIVTVI